MFFKMLGLRPKPVDGVLEAVGDVAVAETECKRLSRTSAADELAEVDLDDVVTSRAKSFGEVAASYPHDDLASRIDEVAGKAGRLRLGDLDPHLRRKGCLDPGYRGLIERTREVDDVAPGQGRETGVEVIEAWVDEMERTDFDVPGIGDVTVALKAGPDAVGSPEVIAFCVEERVSLAFEGGLARSLPDEKPGRLKPAPEVAFFRLPLRMGEAGERDDAVVHESGMTNKDHVGESLLSVNEADIADALQLAVQLAPLCVGQIARGTMQVTCHPRIDDVIYVIPLGWTHQVSWSIEVWEGGEGTTRR